MATPPEDELDSEIAHFDSILADLLKNGHEGKWALVADRKLIGTFDTSGNATAHGMQLFGTSKTFLVRRIVKTPEQPKLTTYNLGLIGACQEVR